MVSCALALASGRAAAAVVVRQADVLRTWNDFQPFAATYGSGLYFDSLADLDGDGWREFLLGDPERFDDLGVLLVLSGSPGPDGSPPRVLREHRGDVPDGYFGGSGTNLGDLNRDGADEYGCYSNTELFIFNGRDGKLLRGPSGSGPLMRSGGYGRPLVPLGDVSGDTVPDFLSGPSAYSGRTFERLYSLSGSSYLMRVCVLGDVDGDGKPDIGYTGEQGYYCHNGGWVTVYSGATGTRLYSKPTWCGVSMADVGDANRDGYSDFAIRDHVYDGRTGTLLFQLNPPTGHTFWMNMPDPAGDLDGNGFPDLVLRTSHQVRIGREFVTQYEEWAIDVGTRAVLWKTDAQLERLPRLASHDWNGDGFPDFFRYEPGERIVLYSGAPTRAETASEPRVGVRAVGSPCGTSARIGASGAPFLGETWPVHLSQIAPGRVAYLLRGPLVPRARCVRVQADSVTPVRVKEISPGVGGATVEIQLPADVSLAGSTFGLQWVLEDPRRVIATAALEAQVGIGPDFPTTCTGAVVLADGTPVPDAVVEVIGLGLRGTTDLDGRFTISGVETQPDGLHVIATALVSGVPMTGHLEPVAPIPGRTTEVGNVVIDVRRRVLVFGEGAPAFEAEDALAQLSDYVAVRQRHLPLDLSPYEVIWETGYELLDAATRARLVDYVALGGGLILDVARADEDEFLAMLLPNQDVHVGGWAGGRGSSFNEDAIGDVTAIPHDILNENLAVPSPSRSLTGTAGGNVLLRVDWGATLATVWQGADLAGGQGRLIVSGLSSSKFQGRTLENLLSFLADRPAIDLLGTVRLADGTALAGARVELIRQGISVRSSSNGSFLLEGASSRYPSLDVAASAETFGVRKQGLTTVVPGPGGVAPFEIVIDSRPLVLLSGATEGVRVSLAEDLVALGLPAGRLRSSRSLPGGISAFTSVWHVGNVLSAAERARLAAYVRSGGAMHLSGERKEERGLNESLELLLDELVLGGGPEIRIATFGAHRFAPDALHGISTLPNALDLWIPIGAGGMTGLGARNVLVEDRNGTGTPSGAVWDAADLAGHKGRVTLLLDADWFRQRRLNILENLVHFLERRDAPVRRR